MKIRALVVEEKDAPFKVEELELAEPGRDEALIRIVASGVCHTDAITRAGDMPMPFPSVLGHEGSGVVEAVGPGVTTLAPGDKVIIGWPSCGECRNCLDGHPRYCLQTGDALVSGRRFKGGSRVHPPIPVMANPSTATSLVNPRLPHIPSSLPMRW